MMSGRGAWGRVRDILAEGGRVAFPPDLGEPDLVRRLPELLDGASTEVLVPHRIRRTSLDGLGPNVTRRSLFAARGGDGQDYAPTPIGQVPRLLADGVLAVDVALVRLSSPDVRGVHSVGPSATLTLDLIRHARHVIAEIDPDLPRTVGDTLVHESMVSVQVPAEAPLDLPPERVPAEPSEVERRIGAHVGALVGDGAHVSIGIGGVAQAVLQGLRDHRNLRVHAGLMSPGVQELMHCGASDPDWTLLVGEAIGPLSLMSFIDANAALSFQGARRIHDPRRLGAYDAFVTINSVLEVDLLGRADCEGPADDLRGGLGGLIDFLVGARLSPRGASILAIPSTTRSGESRITARLDSSAVSVPAYLTDYVVTEWGVADLRGATRRECAERLIEVAHPDHRDVLSNEHPGGARA